MPPKVLVAMSGGVDSSVATCLLKEQGFDLIGVTMNLYCSTKSSDSGCCSMNAAEDAKKVANLLGIPHYTLNFKEDFKNLIIDNFIDEYKNGKTPNPCIRCNQFIKFNLLLNKAKELGADYIATGHYAQIKSEIRNPNSETNSNIQNSKIRYKLIKGKDEKKDQSYVLYRLDQETLKHTMFPLGKLTKEEVRILARKFKLAVAEKKESQEICFIEDDDYARFLKENVPDSIKPGFIKDINGNILGQHEGIAFYTIGQRKGIGAHKGQPKYVVNIDANNNTIFIGDEKDISKKELFAHTTTYVSGKEPAGSMEITAKIRYNSAEAKAMLTPLEDNKAKIIFEKPQRAVTPGQSVVFYLKDEVLGGGIIS